MSGSTDDPILLAAEYALGCLDVADMREAEAQVARDPAFAAEVSYWQRRLIPLHALVAPVQPPPALWSRLALATGIGAVPSRVRGKGFWQGATAVSLAVAASLALFAFLPRPVTSVADQTRFAAVISPLATPAKFLAQTRADGSIEIISLDDGSAPSGRAYQLWAVPQGATVPVSLGLLSPGQHVITPPSRPASQEQLLVSDEPAGGSPTGAPTGAVLFGGKLIPLSPATTPDR